MAPSISVFGLGYVGSVTAACLAHKGFRVVGVDVDSSKVETLEAGRSPIIEAGMPELVAEGHKSGRLGATSDATAAIRESDVSFICVGTPSQPNGKIDLSHVNKVCREIGVALVEKASSHAVALRSTVLPGTTEGMVIPVLEAASGKRAGVDFLVCYNPEFMREGSAVADFLEPPYTILGGSRLEHLEPLREIYSGTPGRMFLTSVGVAEMAKYASNAFHSVKVTFANEIGILAKHLGVDAEALTEIFVSDTRLNISSAYLAPGFAFGGSCLPKDLRALNYRARELDVHLPLLESILASNQAHLDRAVEQVLRTRKRKVGLLGLSFKAGTDDLRESPQVELSKRLLGEGCELHIWDSTVSLGRLVGSNRAFIEEVIPQLGSLLSNSLEEVVASVEVVVIGSPSIDSQALARLLRPDQIVIDMVNLDKSRRLATPSAYQGLCW